MCDCIFTWLYICVIVCFYVCVCVRLCVYMCGWVSVCVDWMGVLRACPGSRLFLEPSLERLWGFLRPQHMPHGCMNLFNMMLNQLMLPGWTTEISGERDEHILSICFVPGTHTRISHCHSSSSSSSLLHRVAISWSYSYLILFLWTSEALRSATGEMFYGQGTLEMGVVSRFQGPRCIFSGKRGQGQVCQWLG